MEISNPDGETIFKCAFKEIVVENYTLSQLLSIDKRLIILAPVTISKRIGKKKRNALCNEWSTQLKEIYPQQLHYSALDVLSLFILNQFRNLSLEEIHTMLNFDISNTLAGKQLIEIGEQIGIEQGVKQGVKQGVRQGRKNEKIATAKVLFQRGFEPEVIREITRLPKKEIQRLLH